MRIAILGATSEIAKDLVLSFHKNCDHELVLYSRRPYLVSLWLASLGMSDRYISGDFTSFNSDVHFDAILNFVGVGNPAKVVSLGSAIFDITLEYDELALNYIRAHSSCRYIFLSSGSVYGSLFTVPANENTLAQFSINDLSSKEWYPAAKLHAECRHRSLSQLPIVDVRVFNYFSHTQDLSSNFLIADILRAIRCNTILEASSDYIVRDYLHPDDFYRLICSIFSSDPVNVALDCYSLAPVDKPTLLAEMQKHFALQYFVSSNSVGDLGTGVKPNYYSINRLASKFGYAPSLTSMAGILREANLVLKCS
jgi:nucleoside-diphosphate-sugar epimerase